VQEPIAGGDGRLDRRREQHGHVRSLAGVPTPQRVSPNPR
jgi:hypothetical protein